MNTALALLIAFILSTTNVTPLNAKYMAREQLGLDRSKPHTAPSCSQPPADNQPPALWYYMDGDTEPGTAYADYLSDLAWYYDQYPSVCEQPAEEMPDPDSYAFLFEDGSFVALDGSTGCLEGWACND